MRSVDELVEESDKRMGEHRGRLAAYERFSNAYFGVTSGRGTMSSDASGRPILRMQDVRADLRSRAGAPNFISPIVDDFVALRGLLPVIKVLPGDESEDAEQLAIKRSRVLRSCWQSSNMDVQQPNAAWYLSCLGDCPYVLDPLLPDDADDLDQPGIYITVYNPDTAYPRFRSGRYSEELEDLYIRFMATAEQIKADYGEDVEGEDGEVLLYYSRQEKRTIIDGRAAKRGNVEHKLGWVPGQWVRNRMVGGRFAQADISQSIDLSEELQALFIVMGDATIESVYSPIKIRNPSKIGGDVIEIGPRSVITVEGDGDVDRIPPSPAPSAAMQIMDTMQKSLYHVTGTIPVRTEGGLDKSNISGRAVHAVQGPMETRLTLSNAIVGYHFERLSQKMLLMYNRIPALASAQMKIRGSEKGKTFQVEFTGDEIGGPSSISIKWDSRIGTTQHERLVMALQAFAQGLVPGTYVIEQLNEDDPEMVLKQAMNQKAMMMAAQQAMQPQQPQGQPPGGPQPGGDPGQQQSAIQGPADHGNALAGGSPSGGPGGAGPQLPPAMAQQTQQPPVPTGASLPNFPPTDQSPGGSTALGHAPQMLNIENQIDDILATVPAAAKAAIVDRVFTGSGLHITVADWKAISAIRAAFRKAGMPVSVTIASGAPTS